VAPGIGSKIRKLREESGLTATELAAKASLSPSMLSQVERDIVTPSISSLRSIATALKVPAFYFLIEESEPDEIVVRRQDRRTLQLPDYNAIYQLLSPSLDKRIEMISFELPSGEATCETPMAHEGEECLVVVSGRLKVVLADREIILETGDSIYFERSLPHQLINIGDGTASAICAISPPSF
jgi:transcriptional regulator with XRE-family HTH domain